MELLNEKDTVWLELDQRTMTYVNPETTPVPEEFSQGSFPFGSACAKLELWKAIKDQTDAS